MTQTVFILTFTLSSFVIAIVFKQGALATENECTPCPPTKYCGRLPTTDFVSNGTGLCAPGFYCKGGIATRTPYPPVTKVYMLFCFKLQYKLFSEIFMITFQNIYTDQNV